MTIEKTLAVRPDRTDALRALLWGHARPSWQSRCVVALLRLLSVKKQTASAAAVQARVRKLAVRPDSHEPRGLGRGVTVQLRHMEGWPVYYTAPSTKPDAGNYVVFLHGGGYINEIVRAHWRLIGFLTKKAGVRCIVPIYPLAPRATARRVVPAAGEVLRRVLEEAGPAKVTVMGNSAGAGLVLAAAQWLRDNGHRPPEQLVLISPGLDFSIPRPEQREIAAHDPVNDIPGTLEMGRLYAGDLDIVHPYVSPLRGDFHGLAPMVVFAGTLDFLYPDSVDLAARARAAGVPVELHLRRDQPHNYVGFPTPEARRDLRSFCAPYPEQGPESMSQEPGLPRHDAGTTERTSEHDWQI